MSLYKTESHSEEIEFIFNQDIDLDGEINRKPVVLKDLKAYCRLLKRRFSSVFAPKLSKTFTNILYLTLDCPPYTKGSLRLDSPLEFIDEMRKQYPENDIRVMIPIVNAESGKLKFSKSFKIFIQNRIIEFFVYKFPKNKSNIQVYGIYSKAFSACKDVSEIAKLYYLVPFLKAARIAIKKLEFDNFKPDIVHSENIPFFLGCEFEDKFPRNIKVLQLIKDFTQIDIAKTEAFWAAINLADKSAIKKICKDKVIKKLIASLFNLHNAKRFAQINDCLKFIYKNYYTYRKYIDKGEDIEENVIFNKLNARVMQIYPQMSSSGSLYFNSYMYTLKRAHFFAVTSETYYNELFNNSQLSGIMYPQLVKNKKESDFVSYGINYGKYGFRVPRELYYGFNSENFRDRRNKNKIAILKEFSADRIKTNFIDPTLFNDDEAIIVGSLDSFYDSPLIFAYASQEIFANGVDVLFNTILKLFELHKSFQVIICIKNGLKSRFIRNWIEFLQENKYINGRWAFIDGKPNLSKFYASADMTLIPRRINVNTPEHFIAMRYGCVPVVSRSGILNDTISDIFDDITNGCGLKTKKGLLTEEDNNELFLAPVMKALSIYQHNPSSWNLLVKNCLLKDCSWSFETLEKYNKIYKELL